MAKRKLDKTVQVGLRIREGLRAALEKSAHVNGVSLNAEMAARLAASLEHQADSTKVLGTGKRATFLKMLGSGIDIIEHDTGPIYESRQSTELLRAFFLNLHSMFRGLDRISRLAEEQGRDFPMGMDSVLAFLQIAYGIDRKTATEKLFGGSLAPVRSTLTFEEAATDLGVRSEDIKEWVDFLGIEPVSTKRGLEIYAGHRLVLNFVRRQRERGESYEQIARQLDYRLDPLPTGEKK